ncbi:MAG: hypothetical protein AAB508_05310 [Patescibacteria group bacterium]
MPQTLKIHHLGELPEMPLLALSTLVEYKIHDSCIFLLKLKISPLWDGKCIRDLSHKNLWTTATIKTFMQHDKEYIIL